MDQLERALCVTDVLVLDRPFEHLNVVAAPHHIGHQLLALHAAARDALLDADADNADRDAARRATARRRRHLRGYDDRLD